MLSTHREERSTEFRRGGPHNCTRRKNGQFHYAASATLFGALLPPPFGYVGSPSEMANSSRLLPTLFGIRCLQQSTVVPFERLVLSSGWGEQKPAYCLSKITYRRTVLPCNTLCVAETAIWTENFTMGNNGRTLDNWFNHFTNLFRKTLLYHPLRCETELATHMVTAVFRGRLTCRFVFITWINTRPQFLFVRNTVGWMDGWMMSFTLTPRKWGIQYCNISPLQPNTSEIDTSTVEGTL